MDSSWCSYDSDQHAAAFIPPSNILANRSRNSFFQTSTPEEAEHPLCCEYRSRELGIWKRLEDETASSEEENK